MTVITTVTTYHAPHYPITTSDPEIQLTNINIVTTSSAGQYSDLQQFKIQGKTYLCIAFPPRDLLIQYFLDIGTRSRSQISS